MKKVVIIASSVILSLFAIIGLGVGSYRVLKQARQDEMVRVVYSDEVKEIIEKRLHSLDVQALTEKGNIKKYKIDIDSIKQNPMGGIMFILIINDNPDLTVTYIIHEDSDGSYYSSGSYSAKLADLLKKKEMMD